MNRLNGGFLFARKEKLLLIRSPFLAYWLNMDPLYKGDNKRTCNRQGKTTLTLKPLERCLIQIGNYIRNSRSPSWLRVLGGCLVRLSRHLS
jgi:hypothetical protein